MADVHRTTDSAPIIGQIEAIRDYCERNALCVAAADCSPGGRVRALAERDRLARRLERIDRALCDISPALRVIRRCRGDLRVGRGQVADHLAAFDEVFERRPDRQRL